MPARIDAHQHFWRYSPRTHAWIGDGMVILKRDYLPSDLKPLLDAARIDGCVAVQAEQTTNETRWLLQLARENPWIRGVVGWADLRTDSGLDELRELARDSGLKGVRHVAQSEPDDRFLLTDDFQRGIASLASMNLTYDILIYARQLPAAVELANNFPNQRFVVDHIAKPDIKNASREPWASAMRELGGSANVYCKVSGMVTEADWHAWSPGDFQYYWATVLDAFGPRRLIFGSDWPVCTLAGSYNKVVGLVEAFIGPLGSDDRAAVFGENARRFYDL